MYLGDYTGYGAAKGAKAAAFHAAFAKAIAAGLAAGSAKCPTPMVINEMVGMTNEVKKTYYDAGGPCGFAWVNVSPGNSPLANWLKKNKLARKAFGGGVDIWISDFGQSVEQKEACAHAMAKVLQMELGLSGIYAASRLD